MGRKARSHHKVLSSCQATLCHSPQLLRGALAASYHLLLGQAPPLPPPVLPLRTPSAGEQPFTAAPPMPMPKQSPRLKRWHPSLELMGNMPIGRATLAATLGGPPSPKKGETPLWFKLLKPSHAEAFLRDSSMVVEARLHFFSKNSYVTEDGNCDLSRIFKKLAVSASLLGTNIYEIQSSWTGPEELKQAKLHPAVPTQRFEIP